MGGSTSTTVTPAPPSPEETAYLTSQQDLAQKQLELLNSQQDFNTDYLSSIKPVLDQQSQLLTTALQAQNNPDPTQAAIDKQSAALQLQNLQDQADLEPLQKQVLQAQLQATLQGPGATPEQSAQIDAATNASLASGQQQISQFSDDALTQLRQDLSPTLGLRPTDTPIVDRGAMIQKAAVNQYGQLVSNLQSANAQAKLNYPLAAAGVTQAGANFAGSLQSASQQFQAGLSDAATTNRLRLLAAAGDSITGGTQQGIGLVGGSRENPLSFAQGSTTTGSTSPGFLDYLNGIGNLGKGLGSMGLSDARSKSDVETLEYDDVGHRWVSFRYKDEPVGTRHVGVIAQEAEKIDPGAVLTDGNGVKFVNYKRLSRRAA